MTKALMVWGAGVPASGSESSLFGNQNNATEANVQFSTSQAVTFSKLGGENAVNGSGTNTVQFRVGGANVTQVASVVGTGEFEDTTHTDTTAAGNLVNIAYTDTGTSPEYSFLKANIEFASGHGSIHGSAIGQIANVPSATRFFAFNGDGGVDGTTTEANVQLKVRAYDTIAAMQVRCSANARTNNSVFKNRKNGADGTGLITFGAGVTGLIEDTAVGDSIADGDLINASITLLTGTENLTVRLIACTLTSSTIKSECVAANFAGRARPASATANYTPIGADVSFNATESLVSAKVGFDGIASNLRCYLSANTYTVDGTLKLFKNGSAVLTTTITLLGGAAWYENTADTVTFVATDVLSFEFNGGTTGDITIHAVAITLKDQVAVALFHKNARSNQAVNRAAIH